MRRFSVTTATFLLGSLLATPSLAQGGGTPNYLPSSSGARRAPVPPPPKPAPPAVTRPPAAVTRPPASVTPAPPASTARPECAPNTRYPQYPGPNAPLPSTDSYNSRYYDPYNPYSPYGYYNQGMYNGSGYSSGYYNGANLNYGESYTPFQGYDTPRRRRR